MKQKVSIIITSISKPNRALHDLAKGCNSHGFHFIVIGDVSSPAKFQIQGCDFYSLERQLQTGLRYAELCPKRHYARKNIGYLLAIQKGVGIIVETDDDNLPYDSFWATRRRNPIVRVVEKSGWVNVYKYFSDTSLWPRGLPLSEITHTVPIFESLPLRNVDCPIQQGLANRNPDVDAIYRLIFPLPQDFRNDRRIALAKGTWCPFNSQNTTWWNDAFPLLYLPAFCSFRMTDIWRSFIAQRIAWENEWKVLFHEATVWQERNEHDLMKDFVDELPGYLHNNKICEELGKLSIKSGLENMTSNLRLCYGKLVDMGLTDKKELALLDAWIEDLNQVSQTVSHNSISPVKNMDVC